MYCLILFTRRFIFQQLIFFLHFAIFKFHILFILLLYCPVMSCYILLLFPVFSFYILLLYLTIHILYVYLGAHTKRIASKHITTKYIKTKHINSIHITYKTYRHKAYHNKTYQNKTYQLKTYHIQNISSQNVSDDAIYQLTKDINDKTYQLQNISTTKRISYKTYQLQNISTTKHIKKFSKFPNFMIKNPGNLKKISQFSSNQTVICNRAWRPPLFPLFVSSNCIQEN